MKINIAYAIWYKNKKEKPSSKNNSIILEILYVNSIDKTINYKLHGFNIYSKCFYYIPHKTFKDLLKSNSYYVKEMKIKQVDIPKTLYKEIFYYNPPYEQFNCNNGFQRISKLEQELFPLRLIEALK